MQRVLRLLAGGRPERHAAFVLGLAASLFALIALPGRYVPIMWHYDRTMIVASAWILAAATVPAVADTAWRRKTWNKSMLIGPAVVSTLIAAGGSVYYKQIGGIGSPRIATLLLAPAAVALAAAAARFVAVIRPPAGRAVAWVLAGAMLAFTFAGMGNTRPANPAGPATCRFLNQVGYCSRRGWEPFIEKWQSAVAPVLALVPSDVSARATKIEQRLDGSAAPGAVATPMYDWGRGPGLGVAQLALALDAANWAVGLTGRPDCDSSNQGRFILAYWMASQASPDAAQALRDMSAGGDPISGSTYASPYVPDPKLARYAAQLLARPSDEVAKTMRENWPGIATPKATVAAVAGLYALKPVEESGSSKAGAPCS